jgi:nitrite reductase/ring-hydroxylating ferredoxin subunit
MATQMDKLLQLDQGLISRQIYSDEAIYRDEMEKVFRRCWLFLGHDSMLPGPGDFITTYMGEDRVLVWRDAKSKLHAFLNSCPHRGNTLCLYDFGNAATITCGYHGWTFSNEGKLTAAPFFNEAYDGGLDRERWGLYEVPKVVSYGGLIFGNWDAGAVSLDDYLGDLKWYLDNILLVEDMGGLEVIPGLQRYTLIGNWKLFSDNFAGDHYHTPTTHRSAIMVLGGGSNREAQGDRGTHGYFELWCDPAHSLGGLFTDDSQYQADVERAKKLGPEVLDYVTERHRRMEERMRNHPARPYGYSHGNCFPNLNLVGASSPLMGRGFLPTHPRGPTSSEVWQYCLVERAAPKSVKQMVASIESRTQAPAGLFGQDDCENFERLTNHTRTAFTRKLPFHYGMGLAHDDGSWPGHEDWHTEGLPGLFGPRFCESSQRRYYKYWAGLMGIEEA